jgi:hypothetical protein
MTICGRPLRMSATRDQARPMDALAGVSAGRAPDANPVW